MQQSSISAFYQNFLGNSPEWYKLAIIACLIINPIIFAVDPYVAGWALVLQFIFTLAMALKCYPLQPGGLLVIEAVAIGMTSPGHIEAEISANLSVLLLLIFMVAGIFFMKELLMYSFTKMLLRVKSKIAIVIYIRSRIFICILGCFNGCRGNHYRCDWLLYDLSQGRVR